MDYYIWLQHNYTEIHNWTLSLSEEHYKYSNNKSKLNLCPFKYIASFDDLTDLVLNKPSAWSENDESWITYIGNWHYNNFGKNEIRDGYRNCQIFDAWSYIAGYPETKNQFWINNTLNESLAAYAWIVYGKSNGLSKNLHNLKWIYVMNPFQIFKFLFYILRKSKHFKSNFSSS